MDKVGTIRGGVSYSYPYRHSYLGFQIAKPLYLNVRHTAESSKIFGKTTALYPALGIDALYPGLDLKLRLMKETATRPAIAIGMESAFGHKRMASEYLTFSKRINNFDLTGGLAWGRLGSAGHIKNPMRKISSHFSKPRQYDSFFVQDTNGWFTGEDIGFFGGVEYFTPVNGLSLKAEYGANDYSGERAAISGFDAPDPWSIGFNYKPWQQADISAGITGGEKIIARLSLQDQIFNWPGRSSPFRPAPDLISPRRQNDEEKNSSNLALSPYRSTGNQIGHVARSIANSSSSNNETISVSLKHKGLKGPTLKLIRRDLEEAILNNHGSPEEIWQDVSIDKEIDNNFSNFSNFSFKNMFEKSNGKKHHFRFILDNKLSLDDVFAGTIYRSSALIEGDKEWPLGIVTGGGVRLNIADNFHRLRKFRLPLGLTVRSDEDNFAKRRVAIDRLYGSWLKSVTDSTHLAVTAGYLEEMYGGFGGEILYRPFGKTFAVGAEGWKTYKRDPFSTLNKGIANDSIVTGHLNVFYEVPNRDFTAYAKIGRYLGKDFGGTIGLKNRFENGTSLEGFITTTDLNEADIFGNTSYLHGGIKLNIPLGNIPFVPNGSEARLSVGPLARTTGQTLDHPLPLYAVTEPFSSRRLNRSWKDLLN